jgi:hypothetical protein
MRMVLGGFGSYVMRHSGGWMRQFEEGWPLDRECGDREGRKGSRFRANAHLRRKLRAEDGAPDFALVQTWATRPPY